VEAEVEKFTNLVVETAKITVGISKNNSPRQRVPWWNKDIKKSIQNKNKALKKFQNTHSLGDFINLKRERAQTRYLVNSSKSASW